MNTNELNLHPLTPAEDAAIAAIIRANLEHHALNLPGTVYFDPELDHLSRFYGTQPGKRGYFILKDERDTVLGGVGYAEFDGFPNCAELQKLYLTDAAKGHGTGQALMEFVIDAAHQAGYRTLYLETHTNLDAAVHLYEKLGFRQINKPACVRHSAMNCFFIKEF